MTVSSGAAMFASPTESDFSESSTAPDSVRNWDEKRVGEWLRSINCHQYEALFKANNFNGDNLLECDQTVMKEMGIKKVGDRIRIFVAIKQLRTKSLNNRKKRNRVSGYICTIFVALLILLGFFHQSGQHGIHPFIIRLPSSTDFCS